MAVFPTPSGQASDPVYNNLAQTPTSGYFVVPEGELGQITNALATAGDASNPKDLLSLSGIENVIGDTVESIKQTVALATGTNSSWTVLHATSAVQVLSLEGAGLTLYTTQAAAQKQATAQTKNVTPTPSTSPNAIPGLSQIGDFFGALTGANLWIRLAKVVIGGALLLAGIAHITGAENAVMSVARKVPIPV